MSIKLSSSLWGRIFFCCVLLAVTAISQSITGTISGIVNDDLGQSISGAQIILIDERTGSTLRTVSNERGEFFFGAVQPATFTIKIEHRGFKAYQRSNSILSANENQTLGKIKLSVGEITEVVTTVAEGEVINTESSDNSSLLTSDQISLISTKGRDISSLLRLMPGVSYEDDVDSIGNGWGTDLPNVSGARGRSTTTSIDGLMGNDIGGAAKLSHTISMDAVAEVKVLQNSYSAEYGNQGGGMISVVGKSGGKNYHGSAYYFGRNEALNANSYFNKKVDTPRGRYRHNIWGFNLGGPIRIPKLYSNPKGEKLFFFYSFEKPDTTTPNPLVRVTVPTLLERQGDFSKSFTGTKGTTPVFLRDPQKTTGKCDATDKTACFLNNKIPKERWNENGLAILNYFPLPNIPEGASIRSDRYYNYLVQNSTRVPKMGNVLRLDYKPTERNSFYVKLQKWRADNEGFVTSGWPSGDQNRWGLNSHYLFTDDGVVGNWIHIFSPRIVNEMYGGWRKSTESFIPSDGVAETLAREKLNFTQWQFFPENNTLGTIPRTPANGFRGAAGTPALVNWLDRWGGVGKDYIYSFADNITFNHSSHTFKAGIYIERLHNGEAKGSNWSGTLSFDANTFPTLAGNTGYSYANALLGNFNNYSESFTRNSTNATLWLTQWYVQDQWKAHSRFTLNYGMRLSKHTQWIQGDGTAATFSLDRFDPAKQPVLYVNSCAKKVASGKSCELADRRALDPTTGKIYTNFQLAGAFVPGTGDPMNGMVKSGDPNYPKSLKEDDGIQWEPRLGFAWNMPKTGNTVLRGMFGMYHAPRVAGGSIGNLANNPPLNRTVTAYFGNINDLEKMEGDALSRPSDVNAIERNAKTPGTYNFSLGIERDLGFKTLLKVNYVGSVGRHLGEERNLNPVPDFARFTDIHPENLDLITNGAKSDNFLRPYRGFGNIRLVTYSTTSNYNALQAQINRRYSRNFQFGIAYTWSKSLDYVNDDNDDVPINRGYKSWLYGPSNFDQRHIFNLNYIWDLPHASRLINTKVVRAIFDNWMLSGTTALVSGKPKNIVLHDDVDDVYSGGSTISRPIMVSDPNIQPNTNGEDGTPYLFDPKTYIAPTRAGVMYGGNAPKNFVRLPGVVNFDLALFKNIKLGEKRNLSFRWEGYNIFNHTNFNDVNADANFNITTGALTSTGFGVATRSRPHRVMQGSLRISF